MDHNSQGPDFGTNYGTDVFGIPGTNGQGVIGPGSAGEFAEFYSGFPQFNTGLEGGTAVTVSPPGSILGNASGWTPVERHEFNYTLSTNLTKVAGKHEIRSGFDFVNMGLDHWQPEVNNPRGQFNFDRNITGMPGYTGLAWNSYAAFLLGQMSGFGKSVQFEVMTTNEDQYGLYVNDRWQVNDKLTVNARRALGVLPDDAARRPQLRAARPDHLPGPLRRSRARTSATSRRRANFAPRLGVAYRLNDDTVFRTGYGRTFNPMPWSRPLRGFYPLSIGYSGAGGNAFIPYGTLAAGIPAAPPTDVSTGSLPLPRGVDMRTPEVGNVERGTIDSWNAFVERRLPGDLALSVGYVATATNNGYADINLNYAESGGNANRQYFAQAGTAQILLWGARTKARYHSLQMAVNRPFKNGLLLKGAYTFSKALNEIDDDGWATLLWSQPSQIGP